VARQLCGSKSRPQTPRPCVPQFRRQAYQDHVAQEVKRYCQAGYSPQEALRKAASTWQRRQEE